MARKAQIIGRATDWAGTEWEVRERRPTDQGFELLIGWPRGEQRGRGWRGVSAILTAELAQYLVQTRPRDVDLPIGRTTWKRLRGELDLRWSWNDWWAARSDDLLNMTLEAFCELHGCSLGAASQRRATLRTKHDQR